jgi:cytoskeletal protein CcmA (bactofilin family)
MPIWKRREREQTQPAPTVRPIEREVATAPPAEFLSAAPMVRTSLGADSVVNGRLSFSSPTRIDGTLHGEVRAAELLIIGEGGIVDGTIHTPNLVVLGNVEGNVVGAERVEIGPQGKLRGAVETLNLVVREGGILNAECRVGTAPGNVRVLPARTAASAAESQAAVKAKR